jgi:hypothetical protein
MGKLREKYLKDLNKEIMSMHYKDRPVILNKYCNEEFPVDSNKFASVVSKLDEVYKKSLALQTKICSIYQELTNLFYENYEEGASKKGEKEK